MKEVSELFCEYDDTDRVWIFQFLLIKKERRKDELLLLIRMTLSEVIVCINVHRVMMGRTVDAIARNKLVIQGSD